MKFRRLSLPLWLRIAGVCVILFGVRQWGENYLSSKPPLIEASPTGRLPNGELPVLWDAPSFSSVDQNGQPVTETELRGHVWVTDFIFTTCTSACPMMTAKMILLQKSVHHPDIRFVSFSADPSHDTPAVLKQYAATWKGDESRWLLLNTDQETLHYMAAGMKVAVMPTDDLDNPILHSAPFFLVDQQGRVRGVYDSLDDKAMKQLAADAEALAGGAMPPSVAEVVRDESPAHTGENLFASLGCAACHNQTRVAPPVVGLFGNSVALDDGRIVLAGEAYLRESILDPAVTVVAGYLPLMPSYRDHLNDEQVDQLVAYLRSLGSSPTEGQAVALAVAQRPAIQLVTVDPVCKMKVPASDSTPHAEYQGKTYYFCSDHCYVAFATNPAKYAGK